MSCRTLLIYPPVSFHEQGAGKARGGDPDLYFMPYGLLTLAAELRAHGFEVNVLNLSSFTWEEAVREIRECDSDLFGISCYTVARHVAARLAAEIRRAHPRSHINAGGPHVSPLAIEWLSHYPAFDSVIIGEGEATLLELAMRLRDGEPTAEIAGTAYRGVKGPQLASQRSPIGELDSLARPWDHFDYGFLITSRGCPGNCSFCCSPALWGQRVRFRSAENVLDELQQLVGVRGHRYLHFKDDTFTAGRDRLLAICQGILDRGLIFRWACDTRVDLLDDEALVVMRRAGCVKVNLGIESASVEVLKHLNKRINTDQARQITAMARNVGMDIRYYLIAGGRGETPQTLRNTFEFLDSARPTHVLLGGLSIFPGTAEFKRAEQEGNLTVEDYFEEGSTRLAPTNQGEQSHQMENLLSGVFRLFGGGEKSYTQYSLAEKEHVLCNHPTILRSHTDLAVAYARQHRLHDAETVLAAAAERFGEENAELLHYRACVRFAQFDVLGAKGLFDRAFQASPSDTLIQANLNLLASAGTVDYRNHSKLAEQLLANLTSSEFLYILDGNRKVTMPGLGLSHFSNGAAR